MKLWLLARRGLLKRPGRRAPNKVGSGAGAWFVSLRARACWHGVVAKSLGVACKKRPPRPCVGLPGCP
eukprot:11161185-Lingulodinium_polyedra.AAC.1